MSVLWLWPAAVIGLLSSVWVVKSVGGLLRRRWVRTHYWNVPPGTTVIDGWLVQPTKGNEQLVYLICLNCGRSEPHRTHGMDVASLDGIRTHVLVIAGDCRHEREVVR